MCSSRTSAWCRGAEATDSCARSPTSCDASPGCDEASALMPVIKASMSRERSPWRCRSGGNCSTLTPARRWKRSSWSGEHESVCHRRGDDADVDGFRVRPPTALNFALLQEHEAIAPGMPRATRLPHRGTECRIRGLEVAGATGSSPGEGASLVAEKLRVRITLRMVLQSTATKDLFLAQGNLA